MTLLSLSSLSTLGALLTAYKVWKENDIHFMRSVSPLSLSILTVLNFQFFGVFMLLGLSYSPQYFRYLTISGVSCFLSSVATNKLSFMFFMFQNQNHPFIDHSGLRSPRVRFYVLLVFSELLFVILAFVFIRYPFFSWYIFVFYSYPIFHILKAVYSGSRKHFKW